MYRLPGRFQICKAVDCESLYPHHFSALKLIQYSVKRALFCVSRDAKTSIREIAYKHESSTLAKVPVLTVETLGDFSDKVIEESDIMCVNIHPFHGKSHRGYDIIPSVVMADFKGAYEFAKERARPYGKHVVVGEIGWPASSEPSEANEGSVDVQIAFLRDFTRYAREENIDYFWFELYDGTWKAVEHGNRTDAFSEFHWGLIEEDHITDKDRLG